MFAFINGIVEVIGRISIPQFVTAIPPVGAWGIWISAGLVWAVSAAACLMRYLGWRRKTEAAPQGEPCDQPL